MIISFGKYKGDCLKNIIKYDKHYIEWLITTDWFKNRIEHRNLYNKSLELLKIENKNIIKTNDILIYTDGACSNNGCINAI